MARRRGIDLNTPRPLRLVEEMNGFSCVVMNREGTRLLSRQIMFFHLGMMAAFLTIIGAPFAWIAAVLNIVLSPKVASWRLEVTQHAVQITELYTRAEPGVAQATTEKGTTGPGILGYGEAPPPTDLPLSEIADMGWTDHSIWFLMNDGTRYTYLLELTSPEDIARLGVPIQGMWQKFADGATMTAEEAAEERKKLAALVQRQQPQG